MSERHHQHNTAERRAGTAENLGLEGVANALRELNQGADIYTFPVVETGEELAVLERMGIGWQNPASPTIIAMTASPLLFPEGYYANGKNGLTNKHNTATGQYELYELYQLQRVEGPNRFDEK